MIKPTKNKNRDINDMFAVVGEENSTKKLEKLNKQINFLKNQKDVINDRINKRFNKFLKEIFYEFKTVSLEMTFQYLDQEIKLYDVLSKNKEIVKIRISNPYTGRNKMYMCFTNSNSSNVYEIIEEIRNDWLEEYNDNKKLLEREKKLAEKMNIGQIKKSLRKI